MTDPYVPPDAPSGSETAPGEPAPGGALASQPWLRPLGVLVSPLDTFRSILARPSWLPPALVLVLLFLAVQFVATQRIDMEAAIREAVERQEQQMSDEQVTQMAEMQSKVGLGCNVLLFPIFLAVVALFFWGLVNVAGGEIGFLRSLAVTAHGLMPNAVSSLLTLPVMLGREEIEVAEAQQGLLASHLAIFAPEDSAAWLTALLARVDLLSLWALALLIVGFKVVGKLSTGAATAIVLLIWLLWVGLSVGMAAMGWAG